MLDSRDEDALRDRQAVGAAAEARLEPLLPLIEFYTREMGELPGRLMIATSFLGDVQLMPGWSAQSPEAQQALEQAQALVIAVMVRLLNEPASWESGESSNLAAAVQRLLDDRSNREQRET
ncbi:MAG: hypothetical protein M3R61_07150 [Chloroflexota bacterium]|nr:hypothetical protein [Chloroflexota bacterium]